MARLPDPAVRERWLRLIQRQQQSKLTIADFCNSQDVSIAQIDEPNQPLEPTKIRCNRSRLEQRRRLGSPQIFFDRLMQKVEEASVSFSACSDRSPHSFMISLADEAAGALRDLSVDHTSMDDTKFLVLANRQFIPVNGYGRNDLQGGPLGRNSNEAFSNHIKSVESHGGTGDGHS